MSKKFLKELLEEVYVELAKDRQEYLASNETEVFKLVVDLNSFKNEVYKQLEMGGHLENNLTDADAQRLQEVVNKYTKNITDTIYTKFTSGTLSQYGEVKGNKAKFSILTAYRKYGWIYDYSKGKAVRGIEDGFILIRDSYKSQRQTLVRNLNIVLRDTGNKEIQGQFLNLGHRGGSAVVEQRVTGAKQRLLNEAVGKTDKTGDTISKKDLESLGLKLFVSQKATKGKTVTALSIESAEGNQARGRGKEKELKERMLTDLKNAIEKLEKSKKWANRKGSDSRTELERKKIIESFDKSIKGKKNVKKKSKNYKPKYSNSKTEKTIKSKTKGKAKKVTLGSLPIQKQPKARTSANSPISLGALINQKLPETVAKNMGLPGLRYRTGRFAQSVKVTDVTETSQGYPSIGYTYRKEPYQTFEQGFKQGSIERDPRKLIDRSIREIAAGLLVGRFYTRRV